MSVVRTKRSNLFNSTTLGKRAPKLISFLALIVLSTSVSGCVMNDNDTVTCGGLNPIRLTGREVKALSDESLRQYATQLKTGELNCNWRRARR